MNMAGEQWDLQRIFNETRVAMTGGRGFIGSRVASMLERCGARISHFEGDLLHADLSGWVQGADWVIHLAARQGGILFQGTSTRVRVFHENIAMTRRVLEAVEGSDVARVFLASSGVVYGPQVARRLVESSPTVSPCTGPVTPYAWSKLTTEVLGLWAQEEFEFDVVVGRFANVYGPRGHFGGPTETVVHALVRKAVGTRPPGEMVVWGDGRAVRNYAYVDDAAAGVLVALGCGTAGQRYNIGTDEAVSMAELAAVVASERGGELSVRFDPTKPSGPLMRVLDSTQLKSIGWEPQVNLRQGIKRTIQWWVRHGAMEGPC